MTSFQVYDDKENMINNKLFNARENYNKIELNSQKKKCNFSEKCLKENRKILGHLTNLTNNIQPEIKNNALYKISSHKKYACKIPPIAEDITENHEDSIDRACLLLPQRTSEISSVPITPDCYIVNDEVLDMSIDNVLPSATKGKSNVEKHELRLMKYYNENQYSKDIGVYLRGAEHCHRPHPLYMSKQPELSNDMRCILVDWLVSISDEYNMVPETLHLAVSYIDRFLSKMSVVRSKLQLVGVAAMMIAAKYEEIYPPDTAEFAFLTNDTYTVKQILRMEQVMLRVLSFDLTTPTVQTFIDVFSIEGNLSELSTNMAMFICELCLVENVQYIHYLPSEMAASSLLLSRHTMQESDIWPENLELISGYKISKLYPILKKQHEVLKNSPSKKLQAVRLKFSRKTFKEVSSIEPQNLTIEY